MRTAKMILLAMVVALVTVTLAHAGTQVQKNQATTIKASVQNNSNDSVRAAVKLTGYDNAGTKIGQLCQVSWLGEGRTANLEFAWNAPAYATGIYWSSKVEVGGDCPNVELPDVEVPVYRFDSDSDSDSDDDSDHH